MLENLKAEISDGWLALILGMMLVYLQHKEAPIAMRIVIAGLSGGIGLEVSPEIDIPYIGPKSEIIVVTMIAYTVADIIFGLLQDRKLIKSAVRSALGVKGGEDG